MNANHEAWKAKFAAQCADIQRLEREIDALGRKLNAAASAPTSAEVTPIPSAAAPLQPTKADVAAVDGYGEPDAGAIQRAGMPTEPRTATKASSGPNDDLAEFRAEYKREIGALLEWLARKHG